MVVLNPEYFTRVINKRIEVIQWNENQIKINKSPSTISISKLTFFTLRVRNLIAAYSRGDNKQDLRTQFSTMLTFLPDAWNQKVTKVFIGRQQEEMQQYRLDPHIHMLWALSFAVLLEVPDEEFKVLQECIDKDGIQDSVFEFLITSRFPDRPPIGEESYRKFLAIPKMFTRLKNIIREPDQEKSEAMVKSFLEKHWLKSYKDFGLDKAHEELEKYYYYGQWALEIAAVVKIKNLDDTTFRDNSYYPDRLVHQ